MAHDPARPHAAEPRASEPRGPGVRRRPARAGDALAGGPFPWALVLLAAALLVGYGVELAIALGDGAAELESFLHAYGLVPREVLGGRVGTLATAMFLHADPFHLLSNVAFLVAFGLELEPRIGARRFALLFLGCGVAAGVLHVATSPHAFVPTVGASGAVSGVLGAWWRLPRPPAAASPPGAADAPPRVLGRLLGPVLLGLWLAAQVAAGLAGSAGEAGWAHLGGFAAGVAAAPRLAGVRARTDG